MGPAVLDIRLHLRANLAQGVRGPVAGTTESRELLQALLAPPCGGRAGGVAGLLEHEVGRFQRAELREGQELRCQWRWPVNRTWSRKTCFHHRLHLRRPGIRHFADAAAYTLDGRAVGAPQELPRLPASLQVPLQHKLTGLAREGAERLGERRLLRCRQWPQRWCRGGPRWACRCGGRLLRELCWRRIHGAAPSATVEQLLRAATFPCFVWGHQNPLALPRPRLLAATLQRMRRASPAHQGVIEARS
mmetsp:Transcript_127425/g.271673  ORF Transcript_127425/g.271673 Transcript_127425/m.271673 type:complete len:247 (-) Transcript_127425:54-794(-)